MASEPEATDDSEQPAEPRAKKQRVKSISGPEKSDTEDFDAAYDGEPSQISYETEDGDASYESEPSQISYETEDGDEHSQISYETEDSDASYEPKPSQISHDMENSNTSYEFEASWISSETAADILCEADPSHTPSETEDSHVSKHPAKLRTRKQRVNCTPEQKSVLLKVFASFPYLTKSENKEIATRMGKRYSEIVGWFVVKRHIVRKSHQLLSPPGTYRAFANGPIRPEFLACLDEAFSDVKTISSEASSAQISKKGKPKDSTKVQYASNNPDRSLLEWIFNKFHYLKIIESKALADLLKQDKKQVRKSFELRRRRKCKKDLIIEPQPPKKWFQEPMRAEFRSHLKDFYRPQNADDASDGLSNTEMDQIPSVTN